MPLEIPVVVKLDKSSARKAAEDLNREAAKHPLGDNYAKWANERAAKRRAEMDAWRGSVKESSEKAAQAAKPVSEQFKDTNKLNPEARTAARLQFVQQAQQRWAGFFKGGGGGAQPPNPPSGGGGRMPLGGGGGVLTTAAGVAIGNIVAQLAVKALNVASMVLRRLWNLVEEHARRIAQITARAHFDSRPLGYATMSGAIGRTFGVGEKEAMQLAMSVQNLAAKFKVASATVASLSPVMTDLHAKTSAMRESWNALVSWMSSAFAPALALINDWFRVMFDTLQRSYLMEALKTILTAMTASITAVTVAITASITAMQLFVNTLGDFVAYILDRAAALATAGFSDKMGWTGKTPMMSDKTKEMWKNLGTVGQNVAIPQTGNANRLPTSTWERMGLVIGAGGGRNPAQETARNTKRTAELLDKILGGMSRGGGEMNLPVMQEP